MTRFGLIHRAILKRGRSVPLSLFWALVAIALPVVLKFGLERVVNGLPYTTAFPAVLLAAIFLGWRWGIFVTFGLAAAVNYFFLPPRFGWSFDTDHLLGGSTFLFAASLIIMTTETLKGAVRDLQTKAEREEILNAELQHRVKNSLAVVQGIARQSIPAEFYEAFGGRPVALGEAHDILATGNWEKCQLPKLAMAALKPFDQRAISPKGPPCALPQEACVPLVLAFHELATNAVKYGALSAPGGRVTLKWEVRDGRAAFLWRETGGPRVETPRRRGLGSRLHRPQSGLDSVSLDFPSEGVTCAISVVGAKSLNP